MHKGLRVDSVQWWRVENPLISILLVYKQPWSFIFKYDQILIKLPKKWDVLNILIMLYNLVKRYKEKRFQKSNDSHINIVLFIAPTADRRKSRAFRYQIIFLYYLFFWCSGTPTRLGGISLYLIKLSLWQLVQVLNILAYFSK